LAERAERDKRVIVELQARAERRESLRYAGMWQALEPDSIICIIGGKRDNTIHTVNGDYATKTPLKTLEKDLPNSFVRCHQSYIVNRNHACGYDGKVLVMSDGRMVEVSRRYLGAVRQIMIVGHFSTHIPTHI